jgi:hypothetical protein
MKLHAFILALIAGALMTGPAAAMDSPKPDPKEPEKKSELEPARAAIAKQDWTGAQALLRQAV